MYQILDRLGKSKRNCLSEMVSRLMKLELVMIGHDLVTGMTYIPRKILPEREMLQRENIQTKFKYQLLFSKKRQ